MYIYSSNMYHFIMGTGGVPVQYAEQPTNGVTYFRAISGISMLPEDLLIYVPLFCTVITQLVTCILTFLQVQLHVNFRCTLGFVSRAHQKELVIW